MQAICPAPHLDLAGKRSPGPAYIYYYHVNSSAVLFSWMTLWDGPQKLQMWILGCLNTLWQTLTYS